MARVVFVIGPHSHHPATEFEMEYAMTIRTYSEHTPWGIEFYAIDDNVYDGGSHGAGVGPTEAGAVKDLLIDLEEVYGSWDAMYAILKDDIHVHL